MRIALLSGASSIHTVRWANGLSQAGHEVHVISQQPAIEEFSSNVRTHFFPDRGVLGYYIMVPAVRKLLREIQPDIINAHYASGYGTTARLVGYRPLVLSVWGSDIYDFPSKSPLHKSLVRKNILAANKVASTSECMAKQTKRLVPELSDIAITPFGVDMAHYKCIESESHSNNKDLVIGTVKTMAPKYGIDTLIMAFALLLSRPSIVKLEDNLRLNLRLVGGGGQRAELEDLVERLGLAGKVQFVGHVAHTQVPTELAKLDIYVALSRLDSESFGVAIIEASAAGRPVVVSDAGGLPEVTVNGITGLVVPREDPHSAADAFEKLILNPELRQSMGTAGKAHVAQRYSWDACVKIMSSVLEETIHRYRNK